MKRLLLLLLLALPLLWSCGGDDVNIRQVGYFKGENNLRYYTFAVDTMNFTKNDLLTTIKKHGAEQMNTKGEITVSFYYFNDAPDISAYLNATDANDVAHKAKPFAAVWIMPTGQINLVKNPH